MGHGAFGEQMMQSAAGGALGSIYGIIANNQQYAQQANLQKLQIAGQKEMTNFNYQKQLQMWKETNYKAQMEQLNQAGLNPGLIYGMSGAGGATTGNTQGNVTGGTANNNAAAITQMSTNAAQLGLLKAQKENIEADTANKQADIPLKGAQTQSTMQGIKNQEAQERLTDMQTRLASWADQLQQMGQNDMLRTIKAEADKITQEIANLKSQQKLTDTEGKYAEQRLKAEIAVKTMDAWLKGQQGLEASQAVKESIRKVMYMSEANMREWDKLGTDREKMGNQWAETLGLTDDFPPELTSLLQAIGFGAVLKKGGTSHTPVTGFHNR